MIPIFSIHRTDEGSMVEGLPSLRARCPVENSPVKSFDARGSSQCPGFRDIQTACLLS